MHAVGGGACQGALRGRGRAREGEGRALTRRRTPPPPPLHTQFPTLCSRGVFGEFCCIRRAAQCLACRRTLSARPPCAPVWLKVTKPKPRDLPVCFSRMMVASSTGPNPQKCCCSVRSSVCQGTLQQQQQQQQRRGQQQPQRQRGRGGVEVSRGGGPPSMPPARAAPIWQGKPHPDDHGFDRLPAHPRTTTLRWSSSDSISTLGGEGCSAAAAAVAEAAAMEAATVSAGACSSPRLPRLLLDSEPFWLMLLPLQTSTDRGGCCCCCCCSWGGGGGSSGAAPNDSCSCQPPEPALAAAAAAARMPDAAAAAAAGGVRAAHFGRAHFVGPLRLLAVRQCRRILDCYPITENSAGAPGGALRRAVSKPSQVQGASPPHLLHSRCSVRGRDQAVLARTAVPTATRGARWGVVRTSLGSTQYSEHA